MSRQSIFLVVAAIGLTPIALSYGLAPDVSLPTLFGIDASDTNTRHIFRAVMGLYLGLVVFWLAGARHERLRVPALWSLVVFMLGLAAGRAVSLVVDGMPHPLLSVYLVLEVLFGFAGLWLLRRLTPEGARATISSASTLSSSPGSGASCPPLRV